MSINDAPPEGGNTTTRPMRDALDSELARTSEDSDGNNVLQLIARKLAVKALDGDLGAIKEIFDRIDGKAAAGSAPEQVPTRLMFQWTDAELTPQSQPQSSTGRAGNSCPSIAAGRRAASRACASPRRRPRASQST
jgi:hypothetical protein